MIAVGILVVVVGIVLVIGVLLPKNHVALRTARFSQPPEIVWKAIADFGASTSWRPDIQRVERLQNHEGRPVWCEIDEHGKGITYEVLDSIPPYRLVRRIADPKLPFGGTWTMEIEASNGGSTVTITESGEVYNPLFRFVSRFIIGHTASIDGYLRALGKKWGEDVVLVTR